MTHEDNTSESTSPGENHSPTDPDYDSVLITADRAEAARIAALFRSAGLRINETVWNEIGHPEYVLDVHKDDCEKANEIFWCDAGPPIASATNSNGEQGDAPGG